MAPRCLQPAMLTLFVGGNNNKNNENNKNNKEKDKNNNNNRSRSFGVKARLPIVTVFAALVLASAGWIGGQDLLSNSGGTSGSGKNNNNNKKIDGWKQDAGSEYRGGHELVGSSACGLCFHALPQRPAWASKARARPSLVGFGLPA
ncbi:unnamed protein product [Polarella glacialis]|uniref:Uncharacterized protein n=1 Tax=Polarella glacialis TaxID=89957 RepID=A0A813IXA8_POLGL|nr:unnamed protein product [Polarella glacialis]